MLDGVSRPDHLDVRSRPHVLRVRVPRLISGRRGQVRRTRLQRPMLTAVRSRRVGGRYTARRRRRAFMITDTELKLMAAAASIGLRSSPNEG